MTQTERETAEDGSTAGEAYVLDDQIGYLLRLANQRHTLIFQENTVLDLTPTQFAAMVRLVDDGECSQNELGRRIAMDVATAKGVVDRLRAKMLVRLRPDPQDRRRTLISADDPDGALQAILHEAGGRITRRTLDPLTRAERRTLLRILAKLI